MVRRIVLAGVLVMVALAGAPRAGHGEVSVNIGINLPGPPALVVVPSSPVMYAPSVPANYFFYGGQYYVFTNDVWYVSSRHNGPWVVVAPHFVPVPILRVPVAYYRVPRQEWRHARREGPPPWAPAWGHRWKEHQKAQREAYRDDRRDERREGRDERRDERREKHRGERR